MPSSHLCFGYFTGLPEHWEAFRSLRDAVQLIAEDDHYTYNVEFLYGLKNLLHKRPQLLERVKRYIRDGRLDISPTLAPSYADLYEGESYIRQFSESQWWLRRRLGLQGRVPLLLRQSRVRPADASDPGKKRDLLLLARALRGHLSPSVRQSIARRRGRGRHAPSQLRSAGGSPGRIHVADHLRPLADRRTDGGKFRLPEQGGPADRGLHSSGACGLGRPLRRSRRSPGPGRIQAGPDQPGGGLEPQLCHSPCAVRYPEPVLGAGRRRLPGPQGPPPGLPAPLRAERPRDVPHHGAVPSSRLRPGGGGEGRVPRLLASPAPSIPGTCCPPSGPTCSSPSSTSRSAGPATRPSSTPGTS